MKLKYLLSSFFVIFNVYAQALDCGSKDLTEKLICETYSLKSLDAQIEKQLKKALKKDKTKSLAIKADQKGWLEQRSTNFLCERGESLFDLPKAKKILCIKNFYEERMGELQKGQVFFVEKISEENESYVLKIRKSKYPVSYDFTYPEFKKEKFAGAEAVNKFLEPKLSQACKITFSATIQGLQNDIVSLDTFSSEQCGDIHPNAPAIGNWIFDLKMGRKLTLSDKDLDSAKANELKQKVFQPQLCQQIQEHLQNEKKCPVADCEDACLAAICEEIETRQKQGQLFDLMFLLGFPKTKVGPDVAFGYMNSDCYRNRMVEIETVDLLSYFKKGSKSEKLIQQIVK